MHFHIYQSKRLWLLSVLMGVVASSLLAAEGESPRKTFGKGGGSFKVEDLPAGQLKSQLKKLNPEAKSKAMEWLHRLHFDAFDAERHLRADRAGGIYFECSGCFGKCGDKGTGVAKAGNAGNTCRQSESGAPVSSEVLEPAIGLEGVFEPVAATASGAIAAPPAYNSRPNSQNHIYLDFNGGYVSGKAWTEVLDGVTYDSWDCKAWSLDEDRESYSALEQAEIRRIWERVAEDYAPFDVNVTTDIAYDPDTYAGNKNKVGWLMITPNTDKLGNPCPHRGAGGVAYGGKFGEPDYFETYQPAWVLDFVTATSNIADACSHEMGHNLGLSHDGTSTLGYYGGHDAVSVAPDWAPIMGVSYKKNMTQWSKASEYHDGNQTQDDLSIIAARLGYRPDDHGSSFATANVLENALFEVSGVIENTSEADYFKFSTEAGTVKFGASTYRCDSGPWGSNLDIQLELYDESARLLAISNPLDNTGAELEFMVPKGAYYVVVNPTGAGSPLDASPTGYTSYGSLGSYSLNGLFVPVDAIQVGYPRGGETLYHDTAVRVEWGSSIPSNVDIKLYKAGEFYADISLNEPNDGRFVWVVPSVLPVASDYRIRIISSQYGQMLDESDADFGISNQPTISSGVDATSLIWKTDGIVDWSSQASTTKDGVDAAQSGQITHNQSSSIETVLTGPGQLTFWWKVSSEDGYDYLRFFIDDVEQGGALAPISGNVDWVLKTLTIAPGEHTVRWTYTKDEIESRRGDAAWVDGVTFTASSSPKIVVEQTPGISLISGRTLMDCGIASLGSSAAPRWLTIRNNGDEVLSGLSLSGGGTDRGDFALGSLETTSLAPGESTTFSVTFAPTGTGKRYADLTIVSNDTGSSPFRIMLKGAEGLDAYEQWARGDFNQSLEDASPGSDPDGDGFSNKQEFAFGLDPTVPSSLGLTYAAGSGVTTPGSPILQDFSAQGEVSDYHAVFIRRKDHAEIGLDYSVEFSAKLGRWTRSLTEPVILTGFGGIGDYEAVGVPYPATVPVGDGSDMMQPKFFRVALE